MATVPHKPLEELIRDLPEDLRQQVRDFVESLLDKRRPQGHIRLRQDWAGALEHYKEKFTSLGLQKKALEWRGFSSLCSRSAGWAGGLDSPFTGSYGWTPSHSGRARRSP